MGPQEFVRPVEILLCLRDGPVGAVVEMFVQVPADDALRLKVDACSGALEMLNPQMKGRGLYELYREEAEAAAQRNKPQPVQGVPQPGSVEWFEALQKKAEP